MVDNKFSVVEKAAAAWHCCVGVRVRLDFPTTRESVGVGWPAAFIKNERNNMAKRKPKPVEKPFKSGTVKRPGDGRGPK